MMDKTNLNMTEGTRIHYLITGLQDKYKRALLINELDLFEDLERVQRSKQQLASLLDKKKKRKEEVNMKLEQRQTEIRDQIVFSMERNRAHASLSLVTRW
jgi:hypothetical protein